MKLNLFAYEGCEEADKYCPVTVMVGISSNASFVVTEVHPTSNKESLTQSSLCTTHLLAVECATKYFVSVYVIHYQ